nr:putative ribonuclease H-like domain-containing protein [Tanacetum cinerariifolium]
NAILLRGSRPVIKVLRMGLVSSLVAKKNTQVNLLSSAQSKKQDDKTKREAKGKSPVESFTGYRDLSVEFEDYFEDSINEVNAASTLLPNVGKISPNNTNTFSAAGNTFNAAELEDIAYSDIEDDVDHHVTQIIGDLSSAIQTRSMTSVAKDQDPSWIEAMQEELLQFKMHKVWILVDFPYGKRAIGTNWVFRNKKDERGIVVRNKARLVTQGHTQEEGINYEEVFTPVSRIEAIRLFLAYASFMGFMVYQMDVKSAFLYGTIKEEVLTMQVVLKWYGVFENDVPCSKYLKCWFTHLTTNGSQFTMSKPHQELASPDQMVFVNPNIYVACIKQFWTTVAVKKVNDVIRLQALVDKKKVVVTKATIREALHLDDAEGVECLPNEEIFTELARMGYEKPSTKLTFYKAFFSSQWKFLIHTILQCMSSKRTSWNEFSSSMASAVICLSSGKGFSGVETPLFEGMLVAQEVAEEGDAEVHGEEVNSGDTAAGDVSVAHGEVPIVTEEPYIPSPTPPTPPPQLSHDIPSTFQV